MNNHIKEIAKNTAIWYVTDRDDLLNDFAIAIIQECMQVSMDSVGLDAEYEAWYLIGQHFGVSK